MSAAEQVIADVVAGVIASVETEVTASADEAHGSTNKRTAPTADEARKTKHKQPKHKSKRKLPSKKKKKRKEKTTNKKWEKAKRKQGLRKQKVRRENGDVDGDETEDAKRPRSGGGGGSGGGFGFLTGRRASPTTRRPRSRFANLRRFLRAKRVRMANFESENIAKKCGGGPSSAAAAGSGAVSGSGAGGAGGASAGVVVDRARSQRLETGALRRWTAFVEGKAQINQRMQQTCDTLIRLQLFICVDRKDVLAMPDHGGKLAARCFELLRQVLILAPAMELRPELFTGHIKDMADSHKRQREKHAGLLDAARRKAASPTASKSDKETSRQATAAVARGEALRTQQYQNSLFVALRTMNCYLQRGTHKDLHAAVDTVLTAFRPAFEAGLNQPATSASSGYHWYMAARIRSNRGGNADAGPARHHTTSNKQPTALQRSMMWRRRLRVAAGVDTTTGRMDNLVTFTHRLMDGSVLPSSYGGSTATAAVAAGKVFSKLMAMLQSIMGRRVDMGSTFADLSLTSPMFSSNPPASTKSASSFASSSSQAGVTINAEQTEVLEKILGAEREWRKSFLPLKVAHMAPAYAEHAPLLADSLAILLQALVHHQCVLKYGRDFLANLKHNNRGGGSGSAGGLSGSDSSHSNGHGSSRDESAPGSARRVENFDEECTETIGRILELVLRLVPRTPSLKVRVGVRRVA